MSEFLFPALILLVSLVLGTAIGYFLRSVKSSREISRLTESNNQLKLQIEAINKQHIKELNYTNKNSEELKTSLQQRLERAEEERESIRSERERLNNELTRKNAEFENLQLKNQETKQEVEKLQEKFSKEFENLANRILDQKSEKFTILNKENIQNLLDPLNQKIKNFEEKVEKNSTDFIERHAQLGKQLEYLNEQNLKISEEAVNLTRALKGDSKMQGNWGEMVLERVLERSGLQKDSEYFIQQSFTSEEGKRLMPDVVIHLPGDKKMIVDSKVSLKAYERYINETDENIKPMHLKEHLISVRRRVDELSAKNYHQIYQMQSPDFVLLFIPVEAAFAVASHRYPNLYGDAFDKNIILVTPTTLLAVLKTIDTMWQNEKQKQNAIDIATQAGALYDSFTGLTEDLLKIGKQLGTVQNSYDTAMKKLTGKGNLLRRVERLKKLGAKASKELDPRLLDRSGPAANETLNP